MTGNINQLTFKFFTVLIVIWIPVSCAFPSPASDDEMVHNDNYDMIMPNENQSMDNMQMQNFEEFYNAENAANDAMAEMEMAESHISMVRVPNPLNAREIYIREYLGEVDGQYEKRVQRSLAKDSDMPRKNVNNWEKVDH